jgi:DNA-binding IclR family transcriptional regulator
VPSKTSKKAISSTVIQGFSLLKCFTQMRPLLGNKELSELCNLPPSTIARLTHTLCEIGLLQRVNQFRKYQLGYEALTLAYPVIANMRERHVARRHMKELTDQTRAQTSMAVINNLDAIYVESFRPEEDWLFKPEIGTTRPILLTAIGHSLLYSLPTDRFNYLMAQAKNTLKGKFSVIRHQIEESFSQLNSKGYCSVLGTYRPELHAVSVPFYKVQTEHPIAFNLSVKIDTSVSNIHKFGPRLIELRDRTAAEMGIP